MSTSRAKFDAKEANRVRSKQLRLEDYDTDKVKNGYLERYDEMFAHLQGRAVSLLELGIHRGGSLKMWRDYFPEGNVVGIDLTLPANTPTTHGLHMFQGDQTDTGFLSRVAIELAPGGFDVIIDDASHIGALTRRSFLHLFKHHLKPGGVYVIEDWGTGYWDDWPDGRKPRTDALTPSPDSSRTSATSLLVRKIASRLGLMKRPLPSHHYGMVGFVKQLIDEVGAHDASQGTLNGRSRRRPTIESVTVFPSIAFVRKA